VRYPAGADAIESSSGTRRSVSGESGISPAERGVWFALRGARRIGAIVVNAPPEESALERWNAEALAARVAGTRGRATSRTDSWVRDTFAAGTRRPAVTPLLLLALLLLTAEAIAVRTTRSIAA
jgi:hypothetical protein